MTPAEKIAENERVWSRIYGHLTDEEVSEFYLRGFIPSWVYEYLRAVRGL